MIALLTAWVSGRVSPYLASLVPYAAGAAAALVLVVGAYQTGARSERRAGEIAALRAALATRDADLKATQANAAAVSADASREAARAARQGEQIRDYERRLSAAAACRLDPRDARRLRELAR